MVKIGRAMFRNDGTQEWSSAATRTLVRNPFVVVPHLVFLGGSDETIEGNKEGDHYLHIHVVRSATYCSSIHYYFEVETCGPGLFRSGLGKMGH